MTCEICIGTAQLGLNYGITNNMGITTMSEARKIFNVAEKAGIKYIDTAQTYGSSEEVVGKMTEIHTRKFKIMTKLAKGSARNQRIKCWEGWENSWEESLKRLKTNTIEAMLIHNKDELKGENGQNLKKWLQNKKSEGKIKKIGISIYESKDLESIDTSFFDIIQIPFSIYDQRLKRDGTISKIAKKGVEIHARSLFLQGLIVSDLRSWPKWANNSAKLHHSNFIEYINQRKLSKISYALGFIRNEPNIKTAIIGICSKDQLLEVLDGWKQANSINGENWAKWALNDEHLLDPRKWSNK